jgi:nucleoside-diphosphate-sugar epimerase
MNILFLGGNRFFGKKLLRKLIKRKKLTIYLINRGNKPNIKSNNIIHIKTNREDTNYIKKRLKNLEFDMVFDNIAYKVKDVADTIKLLNQKKLKYIFVSSIMTKFIKNNYFNLLKKNYTLDEINYGRKKLKIENFLIRKKINCKILRIHSVLSSTDFSKKSKDLICATQKDRNKYEILNKNKFQFLYDEDLVNIIYKIIFNFSKTNNKFFELANEPMTVENFYDKIKITKKNYRINRSKFPFPVNLIINNRIAQNLLNINLTNNLKILKKIQTIL